MNLTLTQEWNKIMTDKENINFNRAEQILNIWESKGIDTEDQRELLEIEKKIKITN